MTIKRNLFGLLLIGIISGLLIGCGGDPTPTPTVAPPTALPTAVPTALPPTPAPQPTTASASSGTASGGTLADALGAVKAASAYKVDLSITGKGNFAAAVGSTPASGAQDEPITLVVMQGQVNGKDAHFVLQGLMTAFLGIEPDKKFEVISAGGKAYLKGPVPLLGALEEKWYVAPPQAASVAQPPLTPGSFLDSFNQAGINPQEFKSVGIEPLDGQMCEVFAGDKAAVVSAFGKLGGAAGASQEELDSIDNAEFKFWVCPDGYLHQVKMLIEGHEPENADQKGAFEILMRISNFGDVAPIEAPADAIPLELPGQPTAPAVSPTP